jgi:uncharacterized protein
MSSKVLFSSVLFDKYASSGTLPEKFKRMIDRMELQDVVKDKWTAIKMHLGRGIGYTTIHPLFVKILIDKLKEFGAKVYITDDVVEGARQRGYTEEYLGVPILPVCGHMGKYFYEKKVEFLTFNNVDVGGNIHDAEVLIDLSHVKGHGVCGYGGACKNIAMGCVSGRTRHQIHGLEGGLTWEEELCIHCNECISSCNHDANSFDKNNKFSVNGHNCTLCFHCVKVCPSSSIKMTDTKYENFQQGMAVCTHKVLETFKPGHVFYINFLTNITAICDCWGLSTPALVPDIGIMASSDLVAIEKACIDSIKIENLIPSGLPQGKPLGDSGHLFERLHGKNPYIQVNELEKRGLGSQQYKIEEVE